VAISGLSTRLVFNLTRVGVIESASSVSIQLGNLKMRFIPFFAQIFLYREYTRVWESGEDGNFLKAYYTRYPLVDDHLHEFLSNGGAGF
jgi:hypothetical protein